MPQPLLFKRNIYIYIYRNKHYILPEVKIFWISHVPNFRSSFFRATPISTLHWRRYRHAYEALRLLHHQLLACEVQLVVQARSTSLRYGEYQV